MGKRQVARTMLGMTYEETLHYLYAQLPMFQKIGAGAYKPGLDNVLLLDEWCGHPHRKFPCIHVAGTNGKGSVSNLLASVLQEAGYKVGLFTSPHLKDFRERIRINGKMISQEEVCDFTERFRRALSEPPFRSKDQNEECFHPSFFELSTAMAFHWFAQEQVDIALIEVGLGGRLDSTNIIKPVLSVITSISFDHMALLGDSLEKIASEKAGIIKKEIPVVVGKNPEQVYSVFQSKANELSAPIHYADKEFRIDSRMVENGLELKVYQENSLLFESLFCALGGLYSRENALTVFSALAQLREMAYIIDKEAVLRGFRSVLSNTGLRGRWDILQQDPLCICDTGHNEAGIRYIAGQLALTPHQKIHIVFGAVNDKDIRHMLACLPKEAVYYFTKADVPRALPETDLAQLATDFGLKGNTYPTVASAKTAALQAADPKDIVCICGSNFVVAEAI